MQLSCSRTIISFMAPNPRVVKACKEMKRYGIAEQTVIPVLKNLLDLYDNNWVYIEDENYRVLSNAFFDGQNDEVHVLCDIYQD